MCRGTQYHGNEHEDREAGTVGIGKSSLVGMSGRLTSPQVTVGRRVT